MTHTSKEPHTDDLRDIQKRIEFGFENNHLVGSTDVGEILDQILALVDHTVRQQTEKVDRFEVIDDTGRAYVKGSIYGSPVKVELSYQDDGRTLKVFVKPREEDRINE